MFDKEGFINDYVEAVKQNNTEKQAEVLGRLTEDESLELRVDLINSIKAELQKEEGNDEHIQFLDAQLHIIDAIKVQEDSASEEAKDNTEAEEVTQDVAADTSAEEAGTNSENTPEDTAESDSNAPAVEEEEGKS